MKSLKEKGITLVALVVTIILLLILAGVTISQVAGNNGLFSRVKQAVEKYKKAQEDEEKSLGKLDEYLINSGVDDDNGEISTAQPKDVLKGKIYYTEDGTQMTGEMKDHETEDKTLQAGEEYILEEGHYEGGIIRAAEGGTSTSKGPHGKTLVTSVRELEHEKIEAEDRLGNPVMIPGQFKVVKGELVEDGIVIEDKDGNQFVWIPVSNVDGNEKEEDLIVKSNGSKVEITLGRYEFSTSDGTPTPKQKGSECTGNDSKFVIASLYKENTNDGRPNGCARAKDLEEFVNSVKINHGYYLGRYEASYGSGSTYEAGENQYKPLVQKSSEYNESSWQAKKGFLWNFITQENASKVCQNMYNEENRDIESDLVNSYAWDTAIVYIEAMGYNNYANARCTTNGNSNTLKNTGDTGDMVCNIYDMAGNLCEWTTEYSTETRNGIINPCSTRGGNSYNGSGYTAYRSVHSTTNSSYNNGGFRPLLYLK